MGSNRQDDVDRVFRELDEVLNETARLQQAVQQAEQQAEHPPEAQEAVIDDDRRRHERRGIVDTRRSGRQRRSGERHDPTK